MFVFRIVQRFVFVTGHVSSGAHHSLTSQMKPQPFWSPYSVDYSHQGLCSVGGKCSVNAETEWEQGVVCHHLTVASEQRPEGGQEACLFWPSRQNMWFSGESCSQRNCGTWVWRPGSLSQPRFFCSWGPNLHPSKYMERSEVSRSGVCMLCKEPEWILSCVVNSRIAVDGPWAIKLGYV